MTLEEWYAKAWAIQRRHLGAPRDAAAARQLHCFPVGDVTFDLDIELLRTITHLFDGWPHTLFARPHHGHRGDAPQTAFIVAPKNRTMRLEAADVVGNASPSD